MIMIIMCPTAMSSPLVIISIVFILLATSYAAAAPTPNIDSVRTNQSTKQLAVALQKQQQAELVAPLGLKGSPVISSHLLASAAVVGQQSQPSSTTGGVGSIVTEPIVGQQVKSVSPNQYSQSGLAVDGKSQFPSPLRALGNAEKLKRGLSNFMNHLNPAPFFVPALPAGDATKTKASVGSQAEPVTIISDSPSAAALIKGPTRLVQARPLGGPLRWGR